MNIGIIGYGVVGKAVSAGFENKCNIFVYDPAYQDMDDDKFTSSIHEVYKNSNCIFVGVPTPMKDVNGGSFNSRIIDTVMHELGIAWSKEQSEDVHKVHPVIVIESAVIPSKIKEYQRKYPMLRLTVSPEYLTENNPIDGFLNPICRIIGGEKEDREFVQFVFEQYSDCEYCAIGYCDAIGAALMKYMENSFLAMKVSFMNQFYDMLKASGSKTTWDQYAEAFHIDPRMGNSHFKVPGPDGERHWGGKCVLPESKVCIIERKTPENNDLKKEILNIEELYFKYKNKNIVNELVFIESCDGDLNDIVFKQIVKVTSREIDEEIFEFKTNSGIFKCTGEHLMPILRKGKQKIIMAKDIKETDLLFIK